MLLHRRSRRQEQAQIERSDARAQIERVIRIRSATRTWATLLQRHGGDLLSDRPVDLEHFDETVEAVRLEAASALDDALFDGFVDYDYGAAEVYGGPDSPTFLTRRGLTKVYGAFTAATEVVREAVSCAAPLPGSQKCKIREALAAVEHERMRLAEHLLSRVETIAGHRFTVI